MVVCISPTFFLIAALSALVCKESDLLLIANESVCPFPIWQIDKRIKKKNTIFKDFLS